jgi:hypothetical protein
VNADGGGCSPELWRCDAPSSLLQREGTYGGSPATAASSAASGRPSATASACRCRRRRVCGMSSASIAAPHAPEVPFL